MTFQVGDRAYYYGAPMPLGRDVIVTRTEEGEDGRVFVRFLNGDNKDVEIAVPASMLVPFRGLDDDLHVLTWVQLQDEIMRLRGYFRSILAQQGDDLCWRDFYVAAAACLPGQEGHLALENLKTCLPRWVMLGNCSRFINSLKLDEPYVALGVPPLTRETAHRPPAIGFDVFLRVHRRGHQEDERWTAATFSPAEYVGSFRAQEAAHNCLTRLLEAADHFERTGEHRGPLESNQKLDSSLTTSKG